MSSTISLVRISEKLACVCRPLLVSFGIWSHEKGTLKRRLESFREASVWSEESIAGKARIGVYQIYKRIESTSISITQTTTMPGPCRFSAKWLSSKTPDLLPVRPISSSDPHKRPASSQSSPSPIPCPVLAELCHPYLDPSPGPDPAISPSKKSSPLYPHPTLCSPPSHQP